MLADLRFALRQLLKSPGFALVAVLSLALGIGANTAIFSLVNEFLLRSLPVKNPEELVLLRTIEGVGGRMTRGGENNGSIDPATGRASSTSFSLLTLERLRAQPSALSEVFAFAAISQPNLLVDGQPETAPTAQLVSGSYHLGLGVSAALGRTLSPADDQPSAPPVAVISYRYWENRFNRDPAVLGKVIQLNKVAVTLVGVTARGFDGAMQAGESADISVPLSHHLLFQPERSSRSLPWYWWIRIMGRLAPGATPTQARASLEPIFQESAREGWLAGQSLDPTPRPTPELPTLAADPGAQGENDTRRQYTKSINILMGLVGLVLVAACANVANLLLARSAARRREIALRLALGASRARIIRQLLAESVLLALLGAAVGTLFAYWGRGLLLASRPFGNTSVVLDLPLDARVLAFTVVVAAGTAVLFGLVPALRATRLNLTAEFQGGARTLGGGGRSRLRQSLMVVQIALSLVLLVSTGLFIRTLGHLQEIDAGFNRRNLVMFRVDAGAGGYSREQYTALHTRILERLERIPGVSAATFSRIALLSGVRQNNTISVAGGTPPADAARGVNMNGLAPNFFAVTGLPLVQGRAFTDRDDSAAPKVAIINQLLAEKYFGRDNPLGRQIEMTMGPTRTKYSLEVVGIARDAKYNNLRGAVPPTLYLPALQQVGGEANFALRASASPGTLYAAIRSAVREIDSTLPVQNLRTMDEQIDRLHAQELLFARLSGFFGVLALALACVGLYGLMSYQVVRRTGEIGLRMALGALPRQVLTMVLQESLALVGLGIILGLTGAFFASRLIATLLFGLGTADPLTYGATSGLLLVTALFAGLLPARRAARVDPMKALRSE